MLKYQIYQCKLRGTAAYDKWYCRIVSEETIGVEDLASHMAKHNTPFSPGTIRGILTDAVTCTKELLLQGKRVAWDNLASFGLGVEHTMGAETADEFSVAKNVKSVRLLAQGIGEFSKSVLTNAASMKENRGYLSPRTGGEDMGGGSETLMATLTLNVNDSSMGSVSGGGTFTKGSTVTVMATPGSGYKFVSWSDGNTSASRSVKVNSSMTLTANFAAEEAEGGGSNTPGEGEEDVYE